MMNKLDAKAFGLAFGVLWAAGAFLMGLLAMVCSWAIPFVNALSVMYVGYDVSFVGSIIGAIWGFIDAFIGGFLLAWLYNKFAK